MTADAEQTPQELPAQPDEAEQPEPVAPPAETNSAPVAAAAQSGPETPPADEEDALPLMAHLLELRDRLLKATAAVLIGVAIGLIFAKQFLELLITFLQGESQLQLLSPAEPIFLYLKAALIMGVVIASPFVLYQIFAFVVPGLTTSEKRGLYIALPMAAGLFALGVSFGIFVVLPFTLRYLQSFLADLIKAEYGASFYMNFVLTFLLWLGIGFELPLFIAILARLGVVSPQQLRHFWRYAIVIIAVLSAVITPTPDPFNMAIVMVPLLLLYVLGIFLAHLVYKKRTPDDAPEPVTENE
jgi:sec-independent protein translocase protein TatC